MAVLDRMNSMFRRAPRWTYIALALAFALIFPVLEQYGVIETLWLRLGTRTLVYVLLAVGLNLVLGETGLLHLGYVAFFAVGAYTTAILSSPRLACQHCDCAGITSLSSLSLSAR
jgi:ABC-type branched-subunit amino acid transport system permease subunit